MRSRSVCRRGCALRDTPLRVGAGFLLTLAALYFIGGTDALCALLLADAVHELGHVLALVLTGTEIVSAELHAAGAVIRCGAFRSDGAEALCAAAGPFAGILAGVTGLLLPWDFCRYTGLVALCASGFNLLPALPLDGGWLLMLAASCRLDPPAADTLLRVTGNLCAVGIVLVSAWLHLIVGIAAGIYLAALVNFPKMR